MHRIIILGPPGAGKGTQAIKLCNQLGLIHISTGEILRQAVESGSDLGKQVKSLLDDGILVPDELVVEVVVERLAQPDCVESGYLLDGFPRTIAQAEALSGWLEEQQTPTTAVLNLAVSEKVLLDRIQQRSKQQGRSDDSAEVAANRLRVYWEQTAPVAEYYRNQGDLQEVDGLGTIEEVYSRLEEALGLSSGEA